MNRLSEYAAEGIRRPAIIEIRKFRGKLMMRMVSVHNLVINTNHEPSLSKETQFPPCEATSERNILQSKKRGGKRKNPL